MADNMLEVVDENDHVIGLASRKDIHANGLWHREAQVLFIMPDGRIIFQRRSKTKDTNPGLLTASVGGHVEQGDTYEDTAIKETWEETGIRLKLSDMVLLNKIKVDSSNAITQTHNKCHRCVYGFVYTGQVEELHIESGESEGYVVLPLSDMFYLPDDVKKQFSSTLTNLDLYGPLYRKLLTLV